MCGIAGALLLRPAHDGDHGQVRRMIDSLSHRGPDSATTFAAGSAVLGSARLAIVDVAGGQQPFSNEAGSVHVVFNGEIYNHRKLHEGLRRRGHTLKTDSDGEVIAHLYEEVGVECFAMLDGQFALAIADARSGALHLARDAMGICPLHWAEIQGELYFCSEIKGLLTVEGMPRQAEPQAILQIGYFGAVCAPLTPFAAIWQLPPAHFLSFESRRKRLRRYWSLQFPLLGEHARLSEAAAAAGLCERLELAVASHSQGEFAATCFLSGGIDSAVIGALLGRRGDGSRPVTAFCATSEHTKLDEGGAAAATAARLGLALQRVEVNEASIAAAFPKLIWHAETPVISTEAVALMLLAGEVRRHSKIVLSGEGADEAFGGYLAFRQFKVLGGLTAPGLAPLRALLRPLLRGYYGSDCLLPAESSVDSLRERFGCFPAQAYEWEFYREAITPLFSGDYRAQAAAGRHWDSFEFDAGAVRGRHRLNRSLYVAYQVMLPNYLLGAHGDRIFAANSVEGRYPFLAREVVEYSATLPPAFKIKGLREKHILRRAAQSWLPTEIAQRPKTRFIMPFGTPFIGPHASPLYSDLLAPETLAAYGYFDPDRVGRVLAALAPLSGGGGGAKHPLRHLALGLAATFVVSTQLWHYLYLAGGDAAAYPGPAGLTTV